MLDNLLEIEIAYSLLKGGDTSGTKDPIDIHYEKLKTEMKVSSILLESFKFLKKFTA